jgi:cytidylate kinase
MAILTLTGELGSGRRVIGERVAALLTYRYISRQSILDSLSELGKSWEEWGKEFDVHCPTLWERHDWSYAAFKAQIQSIYLSRALEDKVVLMGRGGNFLLRDVPYTLRVRITAPIAVRVERVMKKEEISSDAAEWLVRKTDSDSACYINSLYGKRWDDPAEYDLLLDTSIEPIEAIAVRLKDSLLEKEKFNTEDAREILRIKSEAARVKAGLLRNPGIYIPTLEVMVEDGTIVVRGVVHTAAQQQKIMEAARTLTGRTSIQFQLHYR